MTILFFILQISLLAFNLRLIPLRFSNHRFFKLSLYSIYLISTAYLVWIILFDWQRESIFDIFTFLIATTQIVLTILATTKLKVHNLSLSLTESIEHKQLARTGSNKSILIPTVVSLVFMGFALIHLGDFITVDEPKWLLNRIPQYIHAWNIQDFSLTEINDKPGVTPTLLSGISQILFHSGSFYRNNSSEITSGAYLLWRLPLVIFNTATIFILLFYAKTRKTFKNESYGITLAISIPLLVGMTQIVNPDSTLWITSFAFILLSQKALRTKSEPLSIISGIYLGLALLSKFVAQMLLLQSFMYLILKDWLTPQGITRNELKQMLIAHSTALLVYMIFLPASFIEKRILVSGFYINDNVLENLLIPIALVASFTGLDLILQKKISNTMRSLIGNLNLLSYAKKGLAVLLLLLIFYPLYEVITQVSPTPTTILFELRNNLGTGDIIRYAISSLFSVYPLPIIIVLLWWAWATLKKSVHNLKYTQSDIYEISVWILIVAFLLGVFISNRFPTPRYLILIIPLIPFLSVTNLQLAGKKAKYLYFTLLSFAILTICISSPNYILFSNSIANINNYYSNDNWGMGGYEAYEFIQQNYKPTDVIWADREGICEFSEKNCLQKSEDPFCIENDASLVVLTQVGRGGIGKKSIHDYDQTEDIWKKFLEEATPDNVFEVGKYNSVIYEIYKISDIEKVECMHDITE